MIILPLTKETAFKCPHCAAYAAQTWFTLGANQEKKPPADKVDETLARIKEHSQVMNLKDDVKNSILKHTKETGIVIETGQRYGNYTVRNLFLSKCYNCNKVAVWVCQNLVSPAQKEESLPNQDLPKDIIHDFEEARSIVDLSPRGRQRFCAFAFKMLCKTLGEKGDNINYDIASLVEKRLDPLVQKSLDIVRVIGNEAVHGGVMDIKDDKATALNLFQLVNEIAEQMISRTKRLKQMYESLPEDKRKWIEVREKTVGN